MNLIFNPLFPAAVELAKAVLLPESVGVRRFIKI